MNVIFEPVNGRGTVQKNSGVGLGNFDGLHLAHAELLKTLIAECKSKGYNSVIYTFNKHPENIIRKALITPQITTNKKKIELMNSYNLDYLYFASFDERYSRISPEEFVKKILVGRLGIKLAVVGYDYRFGFEGKGDVALLKQLGNKYNFEVMVLEPVKIDNQIVSSTEIRKQLSYGRVEEAAKMLGRPYSIQGTVISGRRIGNTISFPTANLLPEKYLMIPRSGVYLTKTYVNGELYKSLTNIGKNPTFKLDKISVETHIIDFNQNIYNQMVEVFFFKRVRGEKKFSGIEELKNELIKNKEYCINMAY